MQSSNGNIFKKRAKRATKTSNQRQMPVLAFQKELILSQKQEQATKSSKKQRTADGNMSQKPKRATKSNKEDFHSFSSIVTHLLQL